MKRSQLFIVEFCSSKIFLKCRWLWLDVEFPLRQVKAFLNRVKTTYNFPIELRLISKMYKKTTDSELLLHYHSHVEGRYKQPLRNTMLNRELKLSSKLKFSFMRNANASKRPLPDYATQPIMCSLPSNNS